MPRPPRAGSTARLSLLLAPLTLLLASCGEPRPDPLSGTGAVVAGFIVFEDVQPQSGIEFSLKASSSRPCGILQTNGHPVAMIQADEDRLPDLVFGGPDRIELYRNLGGFRFQRVAESGLDRRAVWQGCAVADVDGDGREDLFLSGYRAAALYRGLGGDRFQEVTASSGVPPDSRGAWLTSAGFADVNGDQRPDLYVGGYLRLGDRDGVCEPLPGVRTACGPLEFEAEQGRLFLNDGRFRFRDVTRAAGLSETHGRTLGVAWGDANGDGCPDLYLANDRMPGDLYLHPGARIRRKEGPSVPRFTNRAVESGVAVSPDGYAHAGMGVDWGDLGNTGRADLVVTTYQREATALYRSEPGGLFTDASFASGLGGPTMPFVGYGVRWADFDNDGFSDLLVANGHPLHLAEKVEPGASYAQPFQLFQNRGDETFAEQRVCGPGLPRSLVGRALVAGDLDGDGKIDAVISDLEGPPLLLRNVSEHHNHWVRFRLTGPRCPIGARITVQTGSFRAIRICNPGGSYLSSSDAAIHFGLGSVSRLEAIEAVWPDGHRLRIREVPVDQELALDSRWPSGAYQGANQPPAPNFGG